MHSNHFENGFGLRSEAGFETIYPAVPSLRPLHAKTKQGPGGFLVLLLLALSLGVVAKFFLPAQLHTIFATQDILHVNGLTALLAAVIAGIVLHEAGHLATALLMNFQVLGLAIGPFRVTRSTGHFQFRISPKSLFSGSVSAICLP